MTNAIVYVVPVGGMQGRGRKHLHYLRRSVETLRRVAPDLAVRCLTDATNEPEAVAALERDLGVTFTVVKPRADLPRRGHIGVLRLATLWAHERLIIVPPYTIWLRSPDEIFAQVGTSPLPAIAVAPPRPDTLYHAWLRAGRPGTHADFDHHCRDHDFALRAEGKRTWVDAERMLVLHVPRAADLATGWRATDPAARHNGQATACLYDRADVGILPSRCSRKVPDLKPGDLRRFGLAADLGLLPADTVSMFTWGARLSGSMARRLA